jgi:copper transport protein
LLAAVLPRGDEREVESALPTVSRVSLAAVSVIGITGVYAAWRGIGALDAVFTTTYGLLVVVKVLLFVALLAVAYVSRRVVLDRRTSARRAIRQSVAVEIVLALVVFGATGVLVSEPRGKEALAADHQRPTSASAALGGGRSVTVTVDPGTHGTVTVSVQLSDGPKPQQVSGTASLPSRQLGPIPLGLTANGTNIYGASGIQLPSAGTWVIELVVTTSEFAATTVDVRVHLY